MNLVSNSVLSNTVKTTQLSFKLSLIGRLNYIIFTDFVSECRDRAGDPLSKTYRSIAIRVRLNVPLVYFLIRGREASAGQCDASIVHPPSPVIPPPPSSFSLRGCSSLGQDWEKVDEPGSSRGEIRIAARERNQAVQRGEKSLGSLDTLPWLRNLRFPTRQRFAVRRRTYKTTPSLANFHPLSLFPSVCLCLSIHSLSFYSRFSLARILSLNPPDGVWAFVAPQPNPLVDRGAQPPGSSQQPQPRLQPAGIPTRAPSLLHPCGEGSQCAASAPEA